MKFTELTKRQHLGRCWETEENEEEEHSHFPFKKNILSKLFLTFQYNLFK